MADRFHVRIKPYNKATGHLLRRYVDGPSRMLFREDVGWYRNVAPDVANRLRKVRSRVGSDSGPLAFDVVEEAEALRIAKEEAEALDRAGRATPQSAREPERTAPMRSHDLRARALSSRDIVRQQAREAARPVEDPAESPDLTTRDVRAPAERIGQVRPKTKRSR